jgi:hypothetical protein
MEFVFVYYIVCCNVDKLLKRFIARCVACKTVEPMTFCNSETGDSKTQLCLKYSVLQLHMYSVHKLFVSPNA